MKLESTFGMRTIKTIALVLFITISTYSYGGSSNKFFRVFWNSFKASVKNGNTVTLTWEVTEYNNKSFYIQHSLDGNNWESIDSIVSKQSAESLEVYTYTHSNKTGGKHFYRMKDLDVDMKLVGYSEIISVIIKGERGNLSISPNPASSQLRIGNNIGNDTYIRATVSDLSGRVMVDKRLQSHSDYIDINELIAGIYIVKAESKNGNIFTQKIIKR
jgi:hypothetical protein